MARLPLLDPLRDSNFWLFDVAPIDTLAAFPIFTPLSGFSAITAPEITVETQQINEGNWPYSKYVVKSAAVGSMTLSRGVSLVQSDFWRWTTAAVQGTTGSGLLPVGGVTYRRTLLLVHFFRNLPIPVITGANGKPDPIANGVLQAALAAGGTALVSVTAGLTAAGDTASLGVSTGVASGVQLASLNAATALSGALFGPTNTSIKVPARAFLLKNCIPTRYKTGSDFDASSGQVSIQEMDIQPELVEEISLTA